MKIKPVPGENDRVITSNWDISTGLWTGAVNVTVSCVFDGARAPYAVLRSTSVPGAH